MKRIAIIGAMCVAVVTSAIAQNFVLDGGFETTETGGIYFDANSLVYQPSGTPWHHVSGSGTQGYPISGIQFEVPPPPEGSHIGFVQHVGSSMSQTITLPSDGAYSLTYYVAGRHVSDGGSITYQMSLGMMVVATDSTTDFQNWTRRAFSFTATAGSHELAFENVSVPSGKSNDQTAFFDAISVTPVPEPSEYAAFAGLALLAFGVWRRKANVHA